MLVRSTFGATSTGTPLFPTSVGPYNVYFPDQAAQAVFLSGYTPTGALATTLTNAGAWTSGPFWTPVSSAQMSLLVKQLTAAANKVDQTGPLATAAKQAVATLQADASGVNLDILSTTITDPSMLITFLPSILQPLNLLTQMRIDVLKALLALNTAAPKDTGASKASTAPTAAIAPSLFSINAGASLVKNMATITSVKPAISFSTPALAQAVRTANLNPTVASIARSQTLTAVPTVTGVPTPPSTSTSVWPWVFCAGAVGVFALVAYKRHMESAGQ